MRKKTQSDAPGDAANAAALAAATPGSTQTARVPRVSASRRAKAPRNHRELAQAIFEQCDAVAVGRELLESNNERGNSVKARVWETLVDFLFGKQQPASTASASASANVRIVWDLPAPPHEHKHDANQRDGTERDTGER